MAPAALTWDLWSNFGDEETVMLDVLLPNGFLLNIESRRAASLLDIKMDVWEVAQQCPLYGHLNDIDSYIFSCVNGSTAEQEEQLEETRRLCDVKPFHAVLKLVERKGDKAEKILNSQIRTLIGKGLNEFEAQRNPEINNFRKRMKSYCEGLAVELESKSEKETWQQKLMRMRPVDIDTVSAQLPPYLLPKLHDTKKLVISVYMEHAGSESKCKFSVRPGINANQLLEIILSKMMYSACMETNLNDWLLKICGLQEYIIGPYPLSQYSYVREMLSCGKTPELLLLSSKCLQLNEETSAGADAKSMLRPRCYSDKTLTREPKRPAVLSAWTVDEPFCLTIHQIHRLSSENASKVMIKVGLYHGDELLCQPCNTTQQTVEEGECKWDEEIQFQKLLVSNMPRVARLSMSVIELGKLAKSSRSRKFPENKQDSYANPIAWGNCTVFDFSGILKNGPITLHLWAYDDSIDGGTLLNPLGGVATNPIHDQASVLVISFNKYHQTSLIIYPKMPEIMEYANSIENGIGAAVSPYPQGSKSHLEQLRQICEKDSLYELHEQEKELMWFLRADCCLQLPHSLPKLLRCLKWNDRSQVAQMTALIQTWPTLPPVKALELLDYAYPDQEVRKFAVSCLKDMCDHDLALYSLQLVRALKHESYHQCDLVEFLLRRALQNRNIGHKLFWLLRSEMNFPQASIRFGLILEAYCRGAIKYLPVLLKQVKALTNLKATSELIQNEGNRRKEGREKLKTLVQDQLNQKSNYEIFHNLQNPMDSRFKFRKLRVDKCRFFDSKMRPLYLVFENADSYGNDIFVIFKNGDDLRQDMLTLQMIRIMDKMWKEEGLDFRMIPYQCLATDYKVGLIEVVQNAETIANIQKEKGFTATSAFKKGSILAWLKDHNPDEKSLLKAAEEFTLSCAGYCVATYVLGIADRHSDNIMIQKNGRLFHIDFGHILGKFKEKFGFKRERVPFVLTHDFVYIITKGHTQKSQEFSRFQQYCEQAFMILRRKGPIMISLFAMMLSTGIPELSCEKDLDYLRETLVLDMTEQEALQHFRSKFDEALRSSWKTSVNWMAHNLAKDNKSEVNR